MGNVDFHAFNLRIEIGRLQEKNASLQAENERLKREKILWQQNTVDMAEKINALQSKIDRARNRVMGLGQNLNKGLKNEILDLLK